MLKNIVKISETINEKDYVLLTDNDAPISDIKEFCYRILKFVGNIEDQVKETQKEKKEDSLTPDPIEEPKPE